MTYILIIIPVILLIGLMWLFASYLPKRDLRLGKTKKIDAQNELPTTKIETEKQPISESIKMMEKKSNEPKSSIFKRHAYFVGFVIVFIISRIGTQSLTQSFHNTSSIKSDWQKLEVPSEDFTIDFPATPEHTTASSNIAGMNTLATLNTWTATAPNGIVYQLTSILLPEGVDTSVPENNLHSALSGLAQLSNETIISSKISDFINQSKADDFLVYSKEVNRYTQGKIIIAGHKIYFLIMYYYPESLNNLEFNTFESSFSFQ